MTLKTATLIALVGVGTSYAIAVVQSLGHHAPVVYMLQGALFSIPLMIFLFTLYRKQQ